VLSGLYKLAGKGAVIRANQWLDRLENDLPEEEILTIIGYAALSVKEIYNETENLPDDQQRNAFARIGLAMINQAKENLGRARIKKLSGEYIGEMSGPVDQLTGMIQMTAGQWLNAAAGYPGTHGQDEVLDRLHDLNDRFEEVLTGDG